MTNLLKWDQQSIAGFLSTQNELNYYCVILSIKKKAVAAQNVPTNKKYKVKIVFN